MADRMKKLLKAKVRCFNSVAIFSKTYVDLVRLL
jgi:hypothetical protein